MLKQIHCLSGQTCSIIPLEKRKVIKKTLASSGFLYSIILIFFLIFIYSQYYEIFEEYTPTTLKELSLTAPVRILTTPLYLFIIVITFIILNFIYQVLYYRYYFYDLMPEEVVIMKGVIARNRIAVRYEKIQNIFIDQDFWDRFFKLYDVHIATADIQSGPVSHIDGVSKDNAEKLKTVLTENIKKAKGTNGL